MSEVTRTAARATSPHALYAAIVGLAVVAGLASYFANGYQQYVIDRKSVV